MGIERLVEGSIGPAFAIASDGRIIAVNTAAADLIGQPARELLNRYCGDVINALDGTGARLCRPEGCPTLEALAGGRPTDLPWCAWRTPDGTHLPVSATAVAIPSDARPDSTAGLILLHVAGAHAGSKGATPAAPAGEIRVQLFGRPECIRDGEVQPVPRRRAFELLALLALAGNRGLDRERICEILWPDPSGGSERTHLRVLLHTLRQSLGRDITETVDPDDRGRLRLANDIPVDVVAFERGATALQQCDPATHIGAGAEERLGEIDALLSLYVGDLDEAAQFGAWVLPYRERLRSLYLGLLNEATRLAARAGAVARAMDYCRRAAAADPLQEEFQIALIAAYGQLGRPRDAVAQYDLYQRRLASDLALQPSMAVQRALRQAVHGT